MLSNWLKILVSENQINMLKLNILFNILKQKAGLTKENQILG